MGDHVAISCDDAPAAIGPYAQAVKVRNMIFVSGQIPLDPRSGQIVGADAAMQTRQVLTNLSNILTVAGSQLSNVVKTTVYLTDLNDFEAMNKVYAEFFNFNPPARATVEVSRLPKGVRVEIDAIVVNPAPPKTGALEGSFL